MVATLTCAPLFARAQSFEVSADPNGDFGTIAAETSFLNGDPSLLSTPVIEATRNELNRRLGFQIQSESKLTATKEIHGTSQQSVFKKRVLLRDLKETFVLNEEHRFEGIRSYSLFTFSTLALEQVSLQNAKAFSRRLKFNQLTKRSGARNPASSEQGNTLAIKTSAETGRGVRGRTPDPTCKESGLAAGDIRTTEETFFKQPEIQIIKSCGVATRNFLESTTMSMMPGQDLSAAKFLSPQTQEDLNLLFPPLYIANSAERALRGTFRAAGDFANWIASNRKNIIRATAAKFSQKWDQWDCLRPEKKTEMICQAVEAALLTKGAGKVLTKTEFSKALASSVERKIEKYPRSLVVASVAKATVGYKSLHHYKIFKMASEIDDPLISRTMRKSYARMMSPEHWEVYTNQLAKETKIRMLVSGNAKLIEAAKRNKLDSDSMVQILLERAKARGDVPPNAKEFPVVTELLSPGKFKEVVANGPFIDKGVNSGHGVYTHLVQLDFVGDLVKTEMQGDARRYYRFLATDPKKYWDNLFDAPNVFSPASPEWLSARSRLPIK
ncbi:MAG: hypothetical protein EOP05_09510 [Proteobacteria bacterium]|nr:MAG: hypothetical protein EOP05_09510 [Pseudomonadota bacterium]